MKKPRYFCEHCGAEVARNATVCPVCGRFFSSVKCPKCGFTGKPALFRLGCPNCGYSTSFSDGESSTGSKVLSPPGPLPFWVYILSLTALLIALVVFSLTVL